MYMLSSKIEKAQWVGKTTTKRCGIRETATTRNFVLWLFVKNRNALWHVKICHDAEVVLWLLKEMTTTSSDFMKTPQGVVVVNFYRYNGRDKEDKEEAIQQNRKDEDENQTNDT